MKDAHIFIMKKGTAGLLGVTPDLEAIEK